MRSTLPFMPSENEHLDVSALETWLWDAACAIRGATDAPKFKDFILPLVFYKRLSDVFEDEFAAAIEQFGSEEEARAVIEADHEDALKNLFAKWMQEDALPYLPYTRGWDDKAKERAILAFAEQNQRNAFFKFARNLQNLYEVLSPDAFLRPFIDSYLALIELYTLIRTAYSDRPYVDKELTAKTRDLLRHHSTTTTLEPPGVVRELGPQELAALKESSINDAIKVLNLRKVLSATVERDGRAQPFLLSIGDRAEALAQAYEDRQLTTQQVLAEFEKLANEYMQADAERKRLGLEPNSFAIYTALRPLKADLTAAEATEVNIVFLRYPDYQWSDQQHAKLRADLYQLLRPLVGAKFLDATNTLLKLQRL